MLVCNVSLRPPRAAIAAGIVEAATAVDATATGNIVFATLVDDPASVADIVDAYLGEIMLEAASADATADAGFSYTAAIAETASATDAQDGTATIVVVPTTFDTATTVDTTLTNGNLTATRSASVQIYGGARSVDYKSTGKYFFEMTTPPSGTAFTVGVVNTSGTYADLGSNGINSVMVTSSGAIWANNVNTGKTVGAIISGVVVGVAVDVGARLAWVRKNNGLWNGTAGADPATATGGVTLGSGSFAPGTAFSGGGSVGLAVTGNFGQSAYAFAAPAGFASWSV